MEKGLDYFFRYIDNKLTPGEIREEERVNKERSKLPKSNNAYCAFGGDLEGEEILSLDTH